MSAVDIDTGAEGRLGAKDRRRRSLIVGLREASRYAPSLRRGVGVTLMLATTGAMGALVVPVLLQRLLDDELLGPTGPDVAAATRLGLLAAAIAILASIASWRAMFRLVRTAARGAAAGGMYARLRDFGIDDTEMKAFGRTLEGERSALFLLVRDCHRMRALHEVARFPARLERSSADTALVAEVRSRLAVDPWDG